MNRQPFFPGVWFWLTFQTSWIWLIFFRVPFSCWVRFLTCFIVFVRIPELYRWASLSQGLFHQVTCQVFFFLSKVTLYDSFLSKFLYTFPCTFQGYFRLVTNFVTWFHRCSFVTGTLRFRFRGILRCWRVYFWGFMSDYVVGSTEV